MQLTKQNWTPRRPTLTPLIDVIFLLLLFFMLSSTFTKFGEFELTNGSSGGLEAVQSNQLVFVQLVGETIRINGLELELAAINTRLTELRPAGTELVLISLDDGATSQRFVDVYAAVRAIPGLSVMVVN